MVRSRKLAAIFTLLSGSSFAQMGGMGNSSAMSGSIGNLASSTGWRPWLSANGNYGKTLSSSQQFSSYRPATASFSGGIGGYKAWGRMRLGGGYTGSVSYNPQSANPSSGKWRPSNTVNLSYDQQVSQRLRFFAQQLAGWTHGGYGFASGFGVNGIPGLTSSYGAGGAVAGMDSGSTVFGDPGINGLVDNEIFSSRVKFYGNSGGVNYSLSQRFSISGFGGASFVRRDQGIRRTDSFNGGAQTNYQLSGRSTIGGGLGYFTSRYPEYFGTARGMTYFSSFGHQFSPSMQFSGQLGVANMRSEFISQVALPPELAAILGAGSSLQVAQLSFWSPTFGAALSKSFEVGALTMSAGRSVGMGNGVVMAGMRDMVSIGFGRPLTPRIGANLSTGYSRASGRVGVQSSTETVQGSASLSYRLIGGFSLSVHSGARYFGVPGRSRRSDLFVGGGINWSPGSLPFVF